MALDIPALIRKGLAAAKSATASMPITVMHYPRNVRTPSGVTYGAPTERQAIVEETAKGIAQPDGTVAMSDVKLTILETVTVLDRDKFGLPDGRVLNEMQHKSLLDPDGQPYMAEVWIG